MGLGGISLWQLLIVLLIVVVIFGTARLRSIGTDLGGALKGFRKAMSDAEDEVTDVTKKIDEPDADFNETRTEEQPADHKHPS
jgi:sec-independent protein translocase protein TatA